MKIQINSSKLSSPFLLKISLLIFLIAKISSLIDDSINEKTKSNLTLKNSNSILIENQLLEEKLSKLSKDFPKFGKKILDEFYLDKNYTNVNHGSYGCSPISVLEKFQQYQRELEFNPEKSIRYASLEKSNQVLLKIAEYLDCDAENLVFIENASDGMNAVLKSLFAKYHKDADDKSETNKILIFDIAYTNTKAIIKYLQDNFELEKIEFPVTEEILNYNALINKQRYSEDFISDNDIFESKTNSEDGLREGDKLFNDYSLLSNLKLDNNYDNKRNKTRSKSTIKTSFFEKTFNITHFLTKFEEFLTANLPIKAAVIDHISSTPAITLPVKEIAAILSKYNIISIIDGAHTIGQIDLSMRTINADFYISNFHKWFYAPKTASFLYVNPAFQNKTHPNIISAQYGKSFKTEFLYTGTRDHSVYYAVKDALEFRKELGEEQIKEYSKTLAYLAGMKIARLWNTGFLAYDPDLSANMVNVLIPCDGDGFVCRSVEFVAKVVKETFDIYNTFLPTFKFSNGKYYARFSANIYNEIGDYVYAAEKFLEILRKNEKKKGLTDLS